MNIFKPTWESTHPKKRLATIIKLADPKKLMKIATQASHSDVRIAVASKLFEIGHDDTCLKTIIFELGEKLKNSEDVDVKREAAHYLHIIYKLHQNSNIGENIRSYNGVLIKAGREHTDYHTDIEIYPDLYDYHGEHTDSPEQYHDDYHTDIPAEPEEHFCVE